MSWTGLIKIKPDGTEDATFDIETPLNQAGRSVVQVGSRFLLGGDFYGGPRLYGSTGTLQTFSLPLNGPVHAMTAQVDGRIVLVGDFTRSGGIDRGRVLRLGSDLTLEAAFETSADAELLAVALDESGGILAGGAITTVSGTGRTGAVRLLNDAATHALVVQTASAVLWQRGGASVESARILFEISTDDGATYSTLGGALSRFGGGWQLTGLTLSGDGIIRVRAWPQDSHSGGIIEDTVEFSIAPEISVEDAGTAVPSGGTVDFGNVQITLPQQRVLTIRNTGLDDLALTLPVALSGSAAASYSIIVQPDATVPPGGATTVTVACSPVGTGPQMAILTLTNDDGDEAAYVVNLDSEGLAGPGSVDTTWQPVPNARVLALALRPQDGGMWAGGHFTTLKGLLRGRYGAVGTDGVVLGQTGVGANNHVTALCVLADGSLLLAGTFTTLNSAGRKLARILPDGTFDTTAAWNTAFDGAISAMASLPDGSVIIGGSFTTFKGKPRRGLAKLLPTGALDLAWVVNEGPVTALAVQADGTVYAGTYYHRSIIRISPAGVVDAGYDSTAACTVNGWATHLLLTADSKLVVMGVAYAEGSYSRYIKRLTATGANDGPFTSSTPAGYIYAAIQQADGKILLGSNDASLHGRLNANGTTDASFDMPAETVGAQALALDETGRIHAGGDTFLRRLIAGPASSTFSVVDKTKVKWMRSGMLPEAEWVSIELSEGSSSVWTPQGNAARITGGWELAGLKLPRAGRVRARARCGQGLVEAVTTFSGLPVPDIEVVHLGERISDNGSITLAGRLPGQTSETTLLIRSIGGAPVTDLTLSTSGDFSAGVPDLTTLAAAGSSSGTIATCVIRFAPPAGAAANDREAWLSITSNVPGSKNPYLVLLRSAVVALPAYVSGAASAITSSGATITITSKPNHQMNHAKVYIEHKPNAGSVWTKSAEINIAGFKPVAVSFILSGLTASTLHNVRATIYNDVSSDADAAHGTFNFTTAA